LQALWSPIPKLTITSGLRFDYQNIISVYRNFGNEIFYLFQTASNTYTPILVENKSDRNFTPRISVNYHFTDNANLRLIYARAFRAVPPQEVIRLPFGSKAESELTNNFEAIYAHNFSEGKRRFTLNVFHLDNNRLYQFDPGTTTFNAGSAWNNTGASVSFTNRSEKIDFWANGTIYKLNRPSDAFAFMRDWKNPKEGTGIAGKIGEGGVAPVWQPLPNMMLPLDSPVLLFKAGVSYRNKKGFNIALEFYHNGSIMMLTPANNNVGEKNPASVIVAGNVVKGNDDANELNYVKYSVPASSYFNLYLRQSTKIFGFDGAFLAVKVNNIFNMPVWNVLMSDAQNWNSALYHKPNQLPDFGRRIMLSLSYNLN
jgi:hypothetical protein